MTALLDTHAFIWMDTNSARLSATVMSYFADPACEMLLSVISIWEVVIKAGSGKLTLSAPVDQVVRDIQRRNPLRILAVEPAHVLALGSLPAIHKDPFDRMLIAQAVVENAVLLTADPMVRQYPVRTDW